MLDPNKCVETALLRAIENGHKPRTEPRTGFYASSIGFCPRKQVAERAGLFPTKPPDSRSQFKMWTGTIMGKAVQAALEADGYLDPTWHEKPFELGNYRGKVDGYTPTIPAIVEIKTSDDDAITRYKELPEHYLWQGLWYCLASGIPNLLVFQIGKNQGLVKNRLITLDAEWEDKLRTHMKVMDIWWNNYIKNGELPEHSHQWGWEDRYCPYMELEAYTKEASGHESLAKYDRSG